MEASRESDGGTVVADDGTLLEVAQLIGRELRDADLIGHTDRGTLALVLLDADLEHAERVINRLVSVSIATGSPRSCGSPSAPPAIPLTPSTPTR